MSEDLYRSDLTAALARVEALEHDLQAATARNAELAIENERLSARPPRAPFPESPRRSWSPLLIVLGLAAVFGAIGWFRAAGERDEVTRVSGYRRELLRAVDVSSKRWRKIGVECAITRESHGVFEWSAEARQGILAKIEDCDAKMQTCLTAIVAEAALTSGPRR